MKKLLVSIHRKTLFFRDLVWLVVPAMILITMPLIMWAVLNERIELRGRAASTAPGQTAITWQTSDVALKANEFYVFADNRFFYTGAQQATLHSDPALPGENRTTLEAIWYEDGREMRVNLYFEKDETSWWITEFRSYNGRQSAPDWIYYPAATQTAERVPLGRARMVNLGLVSEPGSPYYGKLEFGNLTVLPFLRDLPCFTEVIDTGGEYAWPNGCRGRHEDGIMCTQVVTPLNPEELASYQDWKSAGSPPVLCQVTLISPTPGVPTATPGSAAGVDTFSFRFRFDGVTDDRAFLAEAAARIHIVTPEENLATPLIPVTGGVNGIYTVSFATDTPIVAGGKVYFLLKGDRHAAMKICAEDQTGPCLPTSPQWLTVPENPAEDGWTIDFTANPLLAGDSDQDYIVNTTDYAGIRGLMNKPCLQLTAAEKARGDLNYDGCVNVRDLFLIQKTLENRYDPS